MVAAGADHAATQHGPAGGRAVLERAVHLALVVRTWPSRSKEPSLVNRLRRFLDNPRVDVRTGIARWRNNCCKALLGQRIRLVIDCTKVGLNFRLMTISIAYRKRTLPLAWSVHRGQPRAYDGRATTGAVARCPAPDARCTDEVWVMGDTGFQTVPLAQWLCRQHWHFVLRQQGRITVRQPGQPWRKLNQFDLAPGQTRSMGWVRLTQKQDAGWFWLILHWEKGHDEPWYLLSERPGNTT